jgi:hypothetical protein
MLKRRVRVSALFSFLFVGSVLAAVPPTLEGVDLKTGKSAKTEIASAPRATVVTFLSAVCPCSNSHEGTLESLRAKYESQGFRFVAIHSNPDEANAAEHFQASPLQLGVLEDPGAKLADAFGALKTPHVFVVSPKGEILYQGGIDDSHQASQAKKHFLGDALAAISSGRTPENQKTRTLGCVISRK